MQGMKAMDVAPQMTSVGVAEAIADGDVRVLLMVLFHLTGDERWLASPYQPKRDARLIPDPGAGLPAEVQQEIRDAVCKLLSEGMPVPSVNDPGNDMMQRMMSVSLGEDVPHEYAQLNREELGLIPRLPEWQAPPKAEALARHRVLIVGAGVSGISLAVNLERLGIPYTIVEQKSWLGGAWNVNRYPGCGVDTPNHSYSFSFGQRYPWSRYFSTRAEVQDYLERIVNEFNLLPRIRFGVQVVAARWVSDRKCWVATLKTDNCEEQVESRILVSAIGQLSDPSMPTIAGANTFNGPLFHSSTWPEDLDVRGKRIAVIGTGATAMQLVPSIADQVESVAVYQRSPQWARPIDGYADSISPKGQWLLEHLPFYAEWFRFNMFWRYGDGLLPYLRKDPSWPHPERSINEGNDRHRKQMTDFILSELRDRSELVAKCLPSYPPFAKRILLDNGWYRTLLKPNVELVDTPISHICSDGVVTSDNVLRKADVVVYATGFKLTELVAKLDIVGRDGYTLKNAWRDDNPTAYLGLTVPKFPNFFSMLGPGSGPAHGGSVIFQAECQTRYISACLVGMIDRGIDSLDVKQSVHDEYLERFDAEHEQLIWSHPGTNTYYRNKHGRVFTVMPWRFVDYWAMTHDPDWSEYEITLEREEVFASEPHK